VHAAGACWNNRNLSDIQPPNVQYWNDGEGNRDTVKTDVLSRYVCGSMILSYCRMI
jgi:endo-beta-N-acetylglucosaminidase D